MTVHYQINESNNMTDLFFSECNNIMTDLNVFQLIQIYLATDNERPIDEKAKFAAFEWTLQQTMALGSTSEIYKSETILSTIIARLFDARKTVLEVIQTATTTDQDTDQQEEDKIDIKADIDDSR